MGCNGAEAVHYSSKTERILVSDEANTISALSDYNNTSLDVSSTSYGVFTLTWVGLTVKGGRAILQAKDDNGSWNDLGGEDGGITLDSETGSDSQIWTIDKLDFPFLRLDYTSNSESTGTLSWTFKGYD